MRGMRRIAGLLVWGGIVLTLVFVAWASLRDRPQDLP